MRIQNCFAKLKFEDRSALITYIMSGDPDLATTAEILRDLPANGADIIELGMPFSDPMADGPAIQEAAIRSLANKTKTSDIFELVNDFRKTNNHTPIILMGYYNIVLHYGIEEFIAQCKKVGVDGLIIVDLPPEEDSDLYGYASKVGVSLIKLVTPTTDADRLQKILPKASGFLYYVSIMGITGTKSATADSVKKAINGFRQYTDLPIVTGFGIKTPANVAEFKDYTDGVVVGSALVNKIKNNPDNARSEISALVRELASAL
jgi:tryptophan synthase alpha chain